MTPESLLSIIFNTLFDYREMSIEEDNHTLDNISKKGNKIIIKAVDGQEFTINITSK